MKHALTLLLVGYVCSHAAADGVIRDGLGARVAGRGGTNIAFADTGTILHDNPAGMVNLAGKRHVECTADVLITNVVYADPDDRDASDSDPIPLGNLAIIHKSADQSLAYGIGFFTPGGFAAEYDLNGPFPFLGKQKYKSFGSLGRVLPGVAYQVSDRLSVGATLGVAISHIELEGPYFLQSAPFAGTPTMMDLQATGAAMTWSLGFQYLVSERTVVGMNYQSETRFHLDGGTRTTIPLMGASAFDTTLDMTWPRSLGLGIRHELTPCHVGSVDVIWYNWSSAFDHAGLHLSNASNPIFAALGPVVTEQVPLLWRDSVSVRLGMEHNLNACHVLRWGYVYHRNPVPAATLTPYLPTTLEHTLAVGVGWRHASGWKTDLAYQFMFRPTNAVGSSGLAGGDFDQSRLRAQAHFLFAGFNKQF